METRRAQHQQIRGQSAAASPHHRHHHHQTQDKAQTESTSIILVAQLSESSPRRFGSRSRKSVQKEGEVNCATLERQMLEQSGWTRTEEEEEGEGKCPEQRWARFFCWTLKRWKLLCDVFLPWKLQHVSLNYSGILYFLFTHKVPRTTLVFEPENNFNIPASFL